MQSLLTYTAVVLGLALYGSAQIGFMGNSGM
jgi:hypothetical protein